MVLSPTRLQNILLRKYGRIGVICHLKVIRKRWRIMETGENYIIELRKHVTSGIARLSAPPGPVIEKKTTEQGSYWKKNTEH